MTTTNANPATDDEFAERRTWRDTLASLRARLTSGEDVDQDELVTAMTQAQAETEVESSRRTRHERKRLEATQAAARKAITDALAGLDPEAYVAARARIDTALDQFWTTVAEEVVAADEYNAALTKAAAPFRDTGLPALDRMHTGSTLPEDIDPDHYLRGGGGAGVNFVWGGQRYVTHSPRAHALDLHIPKRDDWRRRLDRAVQERKAA